MVNWKSRIRDAFAETNQILDDDVLEELAAHAASAYQAARAEGRDGLEAEQEVHALVDAWCVEGPNLRRPIRQSGTIEPPALARSRFSGFMNDVRYGFRMLRRQPKFAALAILTMAIGIGIMTTLFSVINGVLLKPLPWPEPERLVRLSETRERATREVPWIMTNASYGPWRDNRTTIEELAAWRRQLATITGTGDTARIYVANVTASLFPLLRAVPLAGTVFSADDEAVAEQSGKVILSYGMWQERFAGDPGAIGRTIQLEGKLHVIVGVMPRDFAFPDRDTQAWTPFHIPDAIVDGQIRSLSMFSAMARLRPGFTAAQAAAEATSRAQSDLDPGLVSLAIFGSKGAARIFAVPALEAATAEIRPALIVLLFAVALLLLTATANVASLQLARATTRQREIAIRAAIGAGRRRIAQQLITENLMLSMAGGAAGLALSAGLHRVLSQLLPSGFPRLSNVILDWRVMAFVFVLTVVTGMMLGLAPALHVRQLNLTASLNRHSAAAVGGIRSRMPGARTIIMAGQVGMACALLLGAALLSRSLLAMIHADRGYVPNNLLTVRVGMPDFAFTAERRMEVLNAILERMQPLPGVVQSAFSDSVPLGSSENLSAFTMQSVRPPVGVQIQVHAIRHVVSRDFLAAMGIRVVEGRPFNKDDTRGSPKVVVVNRSFADQYLSDTRIGDRISNFARGDGTEYAVVGVVRDIVEHGLTDSVQPEIYSLDSQMAPSLFKTSFPYFVLRTGGDPHALIEPIKSIIREQGSLPAIDSIATMDEQLTTSLARPRSYALLLCTFALSAVLIAAVGLFGVMSYSVEQRTREIAVRNALGAEWTDVVRLVLRQGMSVTITGFAAGVWISWLFAKYLKALLYGVNAHDWLSVVAVFVAIMLSSALACAVPALRASRIDPMRAVREG